MAEQPPDPSSSSPASVPRVLEGQSPSRGHLRLVPHSSPSDDPNPSLDALADVVPTVPLAENASASMVSSEEIQASQSRVWLDGDDALDDASAGERSGRITVAQLIAAFADDERDRPSPRVSLNAWAAEIAMATQRQMLDSLMSPVATFAADLAAEATAGLRQHELEATRRAVPPFAGDLAAHAADAMRIEAWTAVDAHALAGEVDLGARLGDLGSLAATASFGDIASQGIGMWDFVSPGVSDAAALLQDAGILGSHEDVGLAQTRALADLSGRWDRAAAGLEATVILDAGQAFAPYATGAAMFGEFVQGVARYAAGFETVAGLGLDLASPLVLDAGCLAGLGTDALKMAGDLELLVPSWDESPWLPPELAPGTEEGDFHIICFRRDASDKTAAALERMAHRFRWLWNRPRVRAALVRRAQELDMVPANLLRDELQAAMVLVVGSDDQPQAIRFGPRWITGDDGKIELWVPNNFPMDWYQRWFKQAVARAVERSVMERPDRLPTGVGRSVDDNPADVAPLPDGVADQLAGPPDDNPLALLVAELDQSDACRRLAAVLELATPRQRQILRLLDRGFANAEIAQRLGIREVTVRVQRLRLRNKACAKGLAA